MAFFDDSDDDMIYSIVFKPEKQQCGGKRGRKMIKRDTNQGMTNLVRDYLCETPVYNADVFRRRQIVNDLKSFDYFQQRANAAKKVGATAEQKVTFALRMMAYGTSSDSHDEYLRLSETVGMYGPSYLRPPSSDEVLKYVKINASRGLPGMFASLDCMHWTWAKCPRAYHGQYKEGSKKPSVVLEAACTHDLFIWHAFFGMPGASNDINVLQRSPFLDLVQSNVFAIPPTKIEDIWISQAYFLCDGIYPKYSMFIGPIHQPQSIKESKFSTLQASLRKDIERAFGVLKARWAILSTPSRMWSTTKMRIVMCASIILHNMIVKRTEQQGGDFMQDAHRDFDWEFNEAEECYVQDTSEFLGDDEVCSDKVGIGQRSYTCFLRHWALKNALINHVDKTYHA